MSLNKNFDFPDIINLELRVQEKMNDLIRKSQALEDAQNELLKIRQQLLDKEIALEGSKKTINDLRMQLTTANQIIECIEKDKSKYMNEKIQLQINCDAALKERESLREQAHVAKLENMTLKVNLQKLTETACANEYAKNSLETTLVEMQERFAQVTNTLQTNVTKLEKEHQHLHQSISSTVQLNNRLKVAGLCAHAVYTKKNQEIKQLQEELACMSCSTRKRPCTIENMPINYCDDRDSIHNSQVLDAEALLKEVRLDIEKTEAVDKEVEDFMVELENI